MLRTKGVTLLEVLFTLGLTAFALLAVVGVFIEAMKYQRQSRARSVAVQTATSEMEALRGLVQTQIYTNNFSLMPLNVTYDGKTMPATHGFPPAPYPFFQDATRQYFLKVSVQSNAPNMVNLAVNVTWVQGET
ncbi:unnamed protein product, partial [Phaeothamnion confervicola]